MGNLHLFYSETDHYANQLYQNKAESYAYFKTYAMQLQNVLDVIEKAAYSENDMLYQNYIQIIEALLSAYQEQNILRMADIIKGNLLPFIKSFLDETNDPLRVLNDSNTKDIMNFMEQENLSEVSEAWENKNLQAIPIDRRGFYEGLETYLGAMNREDQSIMIDGNHSIAVEKNQSWWYVNSTVNSAYAADQWVKSQETIGENDILFICGLSNGSYLRNITKTVAKDNIIIVYEPDPRIFAANFVYTDMSDILNMEKVFLLVEGINMNVQNTLLSSIISYYTMKYTKFFALPGYDVAYADVIQNFMEKCQKTFEEIQLQNNTIIQKNKNVNYNVIMNLKFMMEGSDIDHLKATFEQENVTDIPAIIVAAGPSLDKNIRYLSEAKNHAFIVATDSSLRMLMKYQIVPDVIVTLDPDKERVLFEDDRVNDIPMIYSVHGTYDILDHNRSKKFLLCNMNFITNMFMDLGKNMSAVDPGGSVANAGFAAARFLGFTKIIMIGQDLAFTNNQKHASVVYDETPVSEAESEMYTKIEGINGEELLTYVNFKAYRDWYENIIEYDDALTFINATEGGAKIHGAEQMTLKEAIEKYCNRNVPLTDLIKNCECTFQQDEKEAFVKKIASYIQDCEDIWRTSRNLKHNYELMSTINQPDKADKLARKCDGLVKQLEDSSVMEFISYYARLDEMQVTQDLYDVTGSEKSIWKELGQRGEHVAASYQKYAVQTKELFEKSYQQLCEIVHGNK